MSKRGIQSSTGGLWVLLAVMLYLLCPIPSVSADSSEPPSEESQRAFGGPDAVGNRLESDRVPTDTPLELDFLKPWYEWKDDLQEEHGLAFGLEYNSAYLTASDRLPGADRNAAGGIFRFSGLWEAFGQGTDHPGTLMFLVEHTDGYTNTLPNSFLSDSLGYAGISNIPYNDEGWRLNTLYWDQKFQDGRFELIAGYLDISDYVDVYPLTSPWTDFFNYAFSIGGGALDLTNDGSLGFAAGAWLTDLRLRHCRPGGSELGRHRSPGRIRYILQRPRVFQACRDRLDRRFPGGLLPRQRSPDPVAIG